MPQGAHSAAAPAGACDSKSFGRGGLRAAIRPLSAHVSVPFGRVRNADDLTLDAPVFTKGARGVSTAKRGKSGAGVEAGDGPVIEVVRDHGAAFAQGRFDAVALALGRALHKKGGRA